jgi:hypothetical protein
MASLNSHLKEIEWIDGANRTINEIQLEITQLSLKRILGDARYIHRMRRHIERLEAQLRDIKAIRNQRIARLYTLFNSSTH